MKDVNLISSGSVVKVNWWRYWSNQGKPGLYYDKQIVLCR